MSMKSNRDVEIEVKRRQAVKRVDAVQYDTSLHITLHTDDFEFPEGATGTAFYKKPSGMFVYQTEGVTVAGNDIGIFVGNDALAEWGDVAYQVKVTSGEDTLTTFTGLIRVEQSLQDDSADRSRYVIPAFDRALAEADQHIEDQRDAAVEHIGNGIDASLTRENFAADAKETGDRLTALEEEMPKKLSLPEGEDYGTAGQIATSDGEGGVAWIDNVPVDETLKNSGEAADAKAAGDRIEELRTSQEEAGNRVGDLEQLMTRMQNVIGQTVNSWRVTDDNQLVLLHDDVAITGPVIQLGGSGGSGGGGGTHVISDMTLHNISGWLAKTISPDTSCPATVNWSSTVDGIPTGNGILRVYVNGLARTPLDVAQGDVTIDLGKYAASSNNEIRLVFEDAYSNTVFIKFTIKVVNVSLRSTFNAAAPYSGAFQFPYTPVGDVEKTVHFKVDSVELTTETVTATGKQQTKEIPAQAHGAHALECWFTAEIDGVAVESNHLTYEFMSLAEGNTTPIIALVSAPASAEQYEAYGLKYRAYNPAALTSAVKIYAGEEVIQDITVGRTEQSFSYRLMEAGSQSFTVECGSVSRTVNVTVAESAAKIGAVTENLVLHLDAAGRSNGEQDPWTWTDGETEAVLTGFNGSTNGWTTLEDGSTVLRVQGGARVQIPYYLFAHDMRSGGGTIEVEFAARNVRDYDAEIISCWFENRGLKVTAKSATLKSSLTEVNTLFKEDAHQRISFTVQDVDEGNRLVSVFVNGVASGVKQYPANDDFSQRSQEVGISIGSDDCAVDIYCIRVYSNCLTKYQIMANKTADTQNVEDMLAFYHANDIFDEYDAISIAKLGDRPYMVLICPELPQYKGDKKTIKGYFVYPGDSSRSFSFEMTVINVQGTSSQGYPVKNFKITFKNGVILDNGTVLEEYPLIPDGIPADEFTAKADYASSEGVNNVELAEMAEQGNPYKTPAQVADSRVRQNIAGFPMLMFWAKTEEEEPKFIGKYNFNNDKGTPAVFGYTYHGDGQSWEVKNNTSNRVLFRSADFTTVKANGDPEWLDDFEARYPEDCTDKTWLEAFCAWVCSTNTEEATGDALPEAVEFGGVTYTTDTADYRLAKFKAQVGDYVETESMDYYYLFTYVHLMVDSRAKNMFINFDGSPAPAYTGLKYKVYFPFYDLDTALGINNEGDMVFGEYYDLEDTDPDPYDADNVVFNGQKSVLWMNERRTRWQQISSLYVSQRSAGLLSHTKLMTMFRNHQAVWGAAVFNEDFDIKYTDPLEEGYTEGLKMANGDKDSYTDFWSNNRYRYVDSQMMAGDELVDMVQLRGYAKADIILKSYIKKYLNVRYGSSDVQVRALNRNQEYTMACPLAAVNDTEINLYGASLLTAVKGLSGLNVGAFDASRLIRLVELEIGSGETGYQNTHLASLTLGHLTLLKKLDIRNCTALNTAVDVSGCENIEEVYAEGSAVPSVTFPVGGSLRKVHLPGTINTFVLREQKNLTELQVESYENVETLRLENNASIVDPFAILDDIKTNSRVRIVGFYLEAQSAAEITALMDKLDTMRGLDEYDRNVDKAQVSGTIHIDSLTGVEVAEFNARYPYITIDADHTISYRTYADYDGTLIKRVTCIDGVPQESAPANPSRTSTAQCSYTFVGWSKSMDATTADPDALDNVIADRTIYAAYSRTVREYPVVWKNADNSTLRTDTEQYGATPSWGQAMPTYSGQTATGWTPEIVTVTGPATYTAVYIPMYTVTWYNDDRTTVLESKRIQQGSDAVYTGSSPVSTVDVAYTFTGWDKATTNVQSDLLVYATYKAAKAFHNPGFDVTGAYAVQWDYSDGDPVLSRGGAATSFGEPLPATSVSGSGSSPFDTVQPWAGMKRYNIINGAVSFAEDSASFDEIANDTVVYIPEFYYACEKDTANSRWTWAISPTAKTGYEKHPGSGRYVGRFHTGGSSSEVFTKSGIAPLANVSQSNFRIYSHNKGANWYMLDLASWSALQLLYLVEFATFNSQEALGKGWNTGSVGTMGGTTGAAYHTIKATGAHNQYRWVEDPFSNVLDNIDGFVASDRRIYTGASDTGYAGGTSDLTATGITLQNSGYITGFGYSTAAPWAFLPSATAGSETTYVTDYADSGTGARVARVGGSYYDDANYGFFYLYAYNGVSHTNATFGSRLLFIP